MVEKNIETALKIIEKYPEISVIGITEINIMIDIKNARFCLWILSSEDYNHTMPFFTAVNLNGNFPHLLTRNIKLYNEDHRFICLYESESIVKSLFTFVEKVEFIIEQLLKLLNLSSVQKEREYQKEFLLYWSNYAVNDFKADLFIVTSEQCAWLNVYENKEHNKRIAHPSLQFNDIKSLYLDTKAAALYIPIVDTRGILPPNDNYAWTLDSLLEIIDNKQIAKIPYETYHELATYSFSKKSIFIIFEMPVNNTSVTFCCEVQFKNPGTMKLLKKIKTNTECIKLIQSTRCDYEFLNTQIGNDPRVLGKKAAIIGIGSLGSYIASEVIRSGINNLTLIDMDKLLPENLMRHRGTFQWRNFSKTVALKFELEWFHPQIHVTEIKKEVDNENILEILPQDIDLVIFAVGSSDVQLACNRVLKRSLYNKPVLFCWLEGNGKASHVMGINYSHNGCYQCLYTNASGTRINNKVNIESEVELEQNTIRNGCGGTRIAYGNSILLQTSFMVLSAIKKVFSGNFDRNFLIHLNGDCISDDADSFYERSCTCCNGN